MIKCTCGDVNCHQMMYISNDERVVTIMHTDPDGRDSLVYMSPTEAAKMITELSEAIANIAMQNIPPLWPNHN